MNIYNVNPKFINELLKKYDNIMHPKNTISNNGGRKYIGVVFEYNEFPYFIPISSGKNKDYYINEEGIQKVKKDSIFSIYLKKRDNMTKNEIIIEVLKLSNMIPIPKSELIPYSINKEQNPYNKRRFQELYKFINLNQDYIKKNAITLRKLYKHISPINYHNLETTISTYTIERIIFLYSNGEKLENCEFYNLNDKKKLYIILKQSNKNRSFFAAIPNIDLKKSIYTCVNLYNITKHNFFLVKNLSLDIEQLGIENIEFIINKYLEK